MLTFPPGNYKVAVSYPRILWECGRNFVGFSLAAGEARKVRYGARLILFVPGAISVSST